MPNKDDLLIKYGFTKEVEKKAKEFYDRERRQNVTTASWNSLSNGEKLSYLVRAAANS